MKSYHFILILIISFLLVSCAESGCPGGMCAPNHYYSSPKSIWSMGTPNYGKRKVYRGKGKMRVRSHYRKGKRVRSIEYNPRFDFSSKNRGRNIESGTFRSGYKYRKTANIESGTFRSGTKMRKSANIEGGTFSSGYKMRKSANIEAGTFKTKGGYKKTANIESGRFGQNSKKLSYTNIEQAPFKSRYKAKRRTARFQKAIRYKEPDKRVKDSQYGLFPSEIEGWEKRDAIYKKRKIKPQKQGHGVKKIEE